MGYPITKEEFGLDLFEAIVCCGSILQLQRMREKTPPQKVKPRQFTAWQQKEADLKDRLREIVSMLPDSNVADLMRRYPFVKEL